MDRRKTRLDWLTSFALHLSSQVESLSSERTVPVLLD